MLGSQAAVFGGVQYAMEEGEKGLVFAHCKPSKTGAGKPWGQGYWVSVCHTSTHQSCFSSEIIKFEQVQGSRLASVAAHL